MDSIRKMALLAMFFISIVGISQEGNVFLERSFWKGNPDLETVKQKIAEGNDATVLNENAFDATIYALLEKADTSVIKYLLSLEGNPVDKKTHDSRIYLHWAAYAGQIEMVDYLLEKGASVSELDSHGYTPLTFAVNAGQKEEALFHIFEKHGVRLTDEKNEDGADLLLLAAPSLTNKKELDFFMNKGFKLDSKDHEGNGIFNYAAKKGTINFLELLVELGADYKSLNAEGGNAFLFAAQGGRGYSNPLPVYTYLKGLGLEPNIVTLEGYTPMHRLAYNTTDPAIFQLFLNAGAAVDQEDAEGNTAFLNAASSNTLKMVELLSKEVKDFNYENKEGQTALMLAVQRNSPEVVAFLVQKGSNVLAKDNKANTLAHYLVASYDHRKPNEFTSKLNLLQDKGLEMNTVQAEGNTLFHLAAKANDLDLLKLVSAFDMDINAKNNEGLTALHIVAMKAEDDQLMKFLISKGADIKVRTDFEETVYDLASENELLDKQNTSLNFLK